MNNLRAYLPRGCSDRTREVILGVLEMYEIRNGEEFFVKKTRAFPYVFARQAMFYELCEGLGLRLAFVGRLFGMHHTTVMHGVIKHKLKLEKGDAQRLSLPARQLRDRGGDTSSDPVHGGHLSLGLEQRSSP